MAERARYEELVRQFSAFGAVKREMNRIMPADCHSGSAAVLTLLGRHGDMRMSRLAELLSVDISVTSRHAAYLAERGWIERFPDPADKRSRILHLTPAGRTQLDELFRRSTQLLAERLDDWTDDEVGRLTQLMTRLRDSFGDGRANPRPTAPAPAPAPAPAQTTRTPAST